MEAQNAPTAELPMRPLLRWAGSKRSAMTHLAAHVPQDYNRYFEPFVGSGALFFHLKPKCATISDLNPELINFYNQLSLDAIGLFNGVSNIPRKKDTYTMVRAAFAVEADPFLRAIQFAYLNRNCFNGLYRTNKSGHFNVPYAEAGRSSYPSEEDFLRAARLIRGASVVMADFRSVIEEQFAAGDFAYLDPPYLMAEGRIFSEYIPGHFSSNDLQELSQTLRLIDNRGGKFIMSFIDDPIVRDISDEWRTVRYEIQRNISGFAGARKRASEILVKNW